MTTALDKALNAIASDSVRVVRANEQGIALDVVASKPDKDTLQRATYRTMLYLKGATLVRECNCPSPRKCYHLAIAELLWRPSERKA